MCPNDSPSDSSDGPDRRSDSQPSTTDADPDTICDRVDQGSCYGVVTGEDGRGRGQYQYGEVTVPAAAVATPTVRVRDAGRGITLETALTHADDTQHTHAVQTRLSPETTAELGELLLEAAATHEPSPETLAEPWTDQPGHTTATGDRPRVVRDRTSAMLDEEWTDKVEPAVAAFLAALRHNTDVVEAFDCLTARLETVLQLMLEYSAAHTELRVTDDVTISVEVTTE